MLNVLDDGTTITPMTAHTGNAGRWRTLRPDPRGRNALDLPFTPAMAAAAARVLEEIRTGTITDSDRFASSGGRNAGGAARVCVTAPPATPTTRRPNSRFTDKSGTARITTA